MVSISVIIPVYNAASKLKYCVDSVIAQKVEDIEIILVDDGSSDESGMICDAYAHDHDDIIVVHQKNSGVSSARNQGLDIARGRFIAFADADDYANGNWLSDMYALMDHGTDLCCAGNMIKYKNKIKPHPLDITKTEKKDIIRELYSKSSSGYLFLKLFRNDIIQKHNIRFKTDIRYCEDEIFVAEYLGYVNKISLLGTTGYVYNANYDIFQSKYADIAADHCVYLLDAYLKIYSEGFEPWFCAYFYGMISSKLINLCKSGAHIEKNIRNYQRILLKGARPSLSSKEFIYGYLLYYFTQLPKSLRVQLIDKLY